MSRQELRFKIPTAPAGKDVTLSLVAGDAGDGNEHDFVVVAAAAIGGAGPTRPAVARCARSQPRPGGGAERMFAKTASYLEAAAEAADGPG